MKNSRSMLLVLLVLFLLCLSGCGRVEGTSSGDISVNDMTIAAGAETVVANGTTSTRVDVTVKDETGAAIEGISVTFSTTAGTLSATSDKTNASGVASVFLQAPTTPSTATVIADIKGIAQQVQIAYVAGQPDASRSAIQVNPTSLLADGTSEAEITVRLADSNGNLVAEATNVTLQSTGGVIYTISEDADGNEVKTVNNTAETMSGRATFWLKAPQIAQVVTLSLAEYAGITATISVGSLSTGDPANVRLAVSEENVFVAGVGKVEQTEFSITVVDNSGTPIDEDAYGNTTINNLRVSFVTRPNGGEYVTGVTAAGTIVDSRATGSIEVRTHNGATNLSFQAGSLPGAVELKVEALLDVDGNLLATPVSASLPLLTVTSGPPHTIALTYPITNSIENLGGGTYRRIGTALVTDRYGNAVPDGTVIYYGLMDSVIAEGTVNVSGSTLTGTSGLFSQTITRNEVQRGIEDNDRVLLRNALAQDKNRNVATQSASTITVQTAYSKSYSSQTAIVGASLLGGQISGTTEQGDNNTLVTGRSTVTHGLADIYVTYPANSNTILTGCGISAIDERNLPLNSARVFTLAWSSDNSATTINEGMFCFAAIAGFGVEALPTGLTFGPTGGSGSTRVFVEDGGDKIPLPYIYVSSYVEYDSLGTWGVCSGTCVDDGGTATSCSNFQEETDCTGAGGSWSEHLSDFTVTVSDSSNGRTVPGGYFDAMVTVSGSHIQPGDKATITFVAGDGSTSVEVEIPDF